MSRLNELSTCTDGYSRIDLILALQMMQDVMECERGMEEFKYWASEVENCYDYLKAENEQLLDRIKRIEEIRFQNG